MSNSSALGTHSCDTPGYPRGRLLCQSRVTVCPILGDAAQSTLFSPISRIKK